MRQIDSQEVVDFLMVWVKEPQENQPDCVKAIAEASSAIPGFLDFMHQQYMSMLEQVTAQAETQQDILISLIFYLWANGLVMGVQMESKHSEQMELERLGGGYGYCAPPNKNINSLLTAIKKWFSK